MINFAAEKQNQPTNQLAMSVFVG